MDEHELNRIFGCYNSSITPGEAVDDLLRIYRVVSGDVDEFRLVPYAQILTDGCIDVGVEPEEMRMLFEFTENHLEEGGYKSGDGREVAARLAVSVARYLKKEFFKRELSRAKEMKGSGQMPKRSG